MITCLLPNKIEDFKKALISKDIDIGLLLKMDSDARTKILREYAGENAPAVNKLFEEKLILKNRELGIKNALKKITQTGKYSPDEKARLDSIKQEWKSAQRERIFSPKENESFLNSLVNKIVGTEVTREESSTLFQMESQTKSLLEKFNRDTQKWESEQDAFRYSASKIVYEKYYNSLIDPEFTVSEAFQDYIEEYKDIYKEFVFGGKVAQITGGTIKSSLKLLNDITGLLFNASVRIMSTADNSFFGIQGNQMMINTPKKWFTELVQSFSRMQQELRGIDTMDAVMAKMYTEPNYINGRMQKAGVIDTQDEQFPDFFGRKINLGNDKAGKVLNAVKIISTPVRVPIARIASGSESAFKGASLMLRINAFNKAITIAEDLGVDVDNRKELEAIGDVIGTAAGRGNIKGSNPFTTFLKFILWSARLLKSRFEIFYNPVFAKSGFAKKQASVMLLKFLAFQSAVIALSHIFDEDDTELDPTSSKFGKVNLMGKYYTDVTGGRMQIVSLASRMMRGGYKSTSDGSFVEYSSAYGKRTRAIEVLSFLRKKLKPGMGVIVDIGMGQNLNYEEVTPKSIALNSFIPLSGQNLVDIIDDDPEFEDYAAMVLNFIGFNSFEYKKKKK